MLQLERIDLISLRRGVRIVEILLVPAFGGDEGVARGVACQSDACLSRFALSFHFICSLTLMVDPTEVRDDDRNWKSDDQHATQTANAADDFARPTNARFLFIDEVRAKRRSYQVFGTISPYLQEKKNKFLAFVRADFPSEYKRKENKTRPRLIAIQ